MNLFNKPKLVGLFLVIFPHAGIAEELGFRFQSLLRISESERNIESGEIKKLISRAGDAELRIQEGANFFSRVWILGGWGDSLITISPRDSKVTFVDTRDDKPLTKKINKKTSDELEKSLKLLSQSPYPIPESRPRTVYSDVPIIICEIWENGRYVWFVRNINLVGEGDYNSAAKEVGKILKIKSLQE